MKRLFLTLLLPTSLAWMPQAGRAEEATIADHMEVIDDAFKAFNRAYNQELPLEEAAVQAHLAQDAALKSSMQVPPVVQAISDPAKKAQAAVEYRRMMGKLFLTLCDVEEAFLAKDADRAMSHITRLRESRRLGHAQFTED